MAEERTYRIQGANAPRLLFELSRLGRRLEMPTGVVGGLGEASTPPGPRERYEIDGAIASVDHAGDLGWLCVIRAEDAAAIDTLAATLGLTAAVTEARPKAGLPGTRSERLALVGLSGLAIAVVTDVVLGAIAVAVLLLLEWGYGGGGSPSG